MTKHDFPVEIGFGFVIKPVKCPNFSPQHVSRFGFGEHVCCIPVVPHEAVLEVSKGKVSINQRKNVPIESFVTTLID